MAGVGRTSGDPLLQPLCSSRVTWSTGSHPGGFDHPQGRSPHGLSGQLSRGSGTPTEEKFLLLLRRSLLGATLCPLSLSCPWAPLGSVRPRPLGPGPGAFGHRDEVPSGLSLLQGNSPSSLSPSSVPSSSSWPSLDPLQWFPVLAELGSPGLGTAPGAGQRGRVTP